MIDSRECSLPSYEYWLQLVPTNRTDVYMFPKYIPQVKKMCCDCGKFLKFEKQTPELIKHINDELEKHRISPAISLFD